jgi:hypothetical protein
LSKAVAGTAAAAGAFMTGAQLQHLYAQAKEDGTITFD